MAITALLSHGPPSAEAELAAFMSGRTGDGAVVAFVGLARDSSRAGPVTGLFLDHYAGFTERSLEVIAADAHARFPVSDIRVIHRCGDVAPGEAIVFVAVAAPHRRAAFEAADYLMDRLKTEAAFWKREDGPDGSRWIEPTDQDRADRQRWSD
ncbi:MAG: molybdenum cofactor biosynthesis protein MoaE [Brevundimonas sp.]|uniref:molybdenum cofactor biosynthesis protein MoaE n=1 Tax=Brevundimonas sp. TaxID=1871086 RepID=UPI00260FB8B9|nr:molybdenum cofactor biosynthesis protein MoaE [Brevundimonas sp.]MDI6625624.1 molybdenum cofactor biosynthesis protein MoaE [Brevundimonas sp.]MDQ7813757.1 molybdenum cofactor biosynthesis protein MoaE [Brevundimonas sp.]